MVFDVGGTISGTFYIPSNTSMDGFSALLPRESRLLAVLRRLEFSTLSNVSNIIIQGVRIRGSSNMPANTKGIMFYERQWHEP